METKIIDLCVKLLAARLTEDYEDIGGYDKKSDDYKFYASEIKDLKTCIYSLLAEKFQWEMGELVEIEDGEAHVLGYWADNQNDYGPHPYRYTEISGFFKNYEELAKSIREGDSLADLESEYTQYPEDGEAVTDESAWREYLDDRYFFKAVSMARFCSGKLKDGKYFVKLGE